MSNSSLNTQKAKRRSFYDSERARTTSYRRAKKALKRQERIEHLCYEVVGYSAFLAGKAFAETRLGKGFNPFL